jgi:hypothetical protein
MKACGALNDDTYKEDEAGMSKKEAVDACSVFCSGSGKKPDWCPGGGLSTGAIVAIALAGVVVIALVVCVVCRCVTKKKKSIKYSPSGV